jgi:hypothetical protein
MWEKRNTYRRFVEKPAVKKTFGRTRHSWKDIRTSLAEVWWRGVKWIHTVQNVNKGRAVFNMLLNLQAPLNARNFLIT